MDAFETIAVDHNKKPSSGRDSSLDTTTGNAAQHSNSVDELFNQIQSDMRRPDITQDAVAAAFEAIQRMGHDGDPEPSLSSATPGAHACSACGVPNIADNRFCAACGGFLGESSVQPVAGGEPTAASGQHHYHHHYHHHYFPAAQAPTAINQVQRPVGKAIPARDNARTPLSAGMSRAETAVRKVAQDWAQACNTKHLDDMVELYAADATVLRPNVPPVRGTAAIREFFFGVLEAGLGEVEMEPQRVELFGDVAFEAGRCKMLVPVAMSKRREERGKYLIVHTRQSSGEWKVIADSWSSDLSLAVGTESVSKPGLQVPGALSRKGA